MHGVPAVSRCCPPPLPVIAARRFPKAWVARANNRRPGLYIADYQVRADVCW